MTSIKKKFLVTGHIEGISYLLLLFIAMPLKYIFEMPKAVTLAGTLHGVLFVAYVLLLAIMHLQLKLTLIKTAILFLLSIIPFGTFYLRRYLPATE